MNAQHTRPSARMGHRLTCPECGNERRFIQVMAEETNLVNGSLDHIRLLEGIVDHYICWKCGRTIPIELTERNE